MTAITEADSKMLLSHGPDIATTLRSDAFEGCNLTHLNIAIRRTTILQLAEAKGYNRTNLKIAIVGGGVSVR